LVSPRRCLGAVIGLTFGCYVFYGAFDHWFYLRFLLPAFPAIFVLMAAAVRSAYHEMPSYAGVPVALVTVAAVVPFSVKAGADEGIFRQAVFEQRHVKTAHEIAVRTQPTAAVLAVQHSGSVRYYANRITLRYDWVAGNDLDTVIRDLRSNGYQPYLVLDDWEEADFKGRFARLSRAGRLDWPPLARVAGNPEVRIYDLTAR
jgi:hypothetical protein